MRTISIAAVAAVAVLGSAYANAASNDGATTSNTAVTTGSAPTNAGSLRAGGGPIRNIAYVYSTSSPGGTGQVTWSVPNPGKGVYAASFTANFVPQGTPAAPVTFSCYIRRPSAALLAQSTSSSTYTSGFYVGVNGGNTVAMKAHGHLSVGCGTADGSAWTWGSRSVQVTLTRLDGKSNGAVSAPTKKATGSASVTGR